jgi:hypothetical protein
MAKPISSDHNMFLRTPTVGNKPEASAWPNTIE